jgi:hypothetical protein
VTPFWFGLLGSSAEAQSKSMACYKIYLASLMYLGQVFDNNSLNLSSVNRKASLPKVFQENSSVQGWFQLQHLN